MSGQISENPERMLDPERDSRNQRLAAIRSRAAEVMGSKADAESWLVCPAMGLDGRRPVDLVESVAGRGLVEEFLTRVEHGVYV